jgi:hypothetical protein
MSKVAVKTDVLNAIIAVVKGTIVTAEAYDSGDGSTVTFANTLVNNPIVPGSLTFTDGTEDFTDNADGTLTGDAGGTGTINYTTGAASVTFAVAPTTGTDNITASYRYGNAGFGTVNRNREAFGGGHIEIECVDAPSGRKLQIEVNIQEFAKPSADVGGIR